MSHLPEASSYLACRGDNGVFLVNQNEHGEILDTENIDLRIRQESGSSLPSLDDSHIAQVSHKTGGLRGSDVPRLLTFWIRVGQPTQGGHQPQLVLACRRRSEHTAYEQVQLVGRTTRYWTPLKGQNRDDVMEVFGGPTKLEAALAAKCFRQAFEENEGESIPVSQVTELSSKYNSFWIGIADKSGYCHKVVRYGITFLPVQHECVASLQLYFEGSLRNSDKDDSPFCGAWQEDLTQWKALDERNITMNPRDSDNGTLWFDLPATTIGAYPSYRCHIYCKSKSKRFINVGKVYLVEEVNEEKPETPELGWTMSIESMFFGNTNTTDGNKIPACFYRLRWNLDTFDRGLESQDLLYVGKWYHVALALLPAKLNQFNEEIFLGIDGVLQQRLSLSAPVASIALKGPLFGFYVSSNALINLLDGQAVCTSYPEETFSYLSRIRKSQCGDEWSSFLGELADISERTLSLSTTDDKSISRIFLDLFSDSTWSSLRSECQPSCLPPLISAPYLSFNDILQARNPNCFPPDSHHRSFYPWNRVKITSAIVHDCGLTNYKEDSSNVLWNDSTNMLSQESGQLMNSSQQLYRPRNPEGVYGHCYRVEHWSHFDCFIYFAHQRVSIPPSSWIRAAKAQGDGRIKVLGTLITEHMEGEADTWNLLDGFWPSQSSSRTMASGTRIVEALAFLAWSYGFDGWLVNLESDLPGCATHTDEANQACINMLQSLTGWVKYYVGQRTGVVLWYDSVTVDGIVNWQSCLNDKNYMYPQACDGIYCDYHWNDSDSTSPNSSRAMMERLCGDINVLYGTDVWGRGTFGGGQFDCKLGIDPPFTAGLSVALFGPAWSYENDSADCCGALGTEEWEYSQNNLWHGHGSADQKLYFKSSRNDWKIPLPDLQWVEYHGATRCIQVSVACLTLHDTLRDWCKDLAFCEKIEEAKCRLEYFLVVSSSHDALDNALHEMHSRDKEPNWNSNGVKKIRKISKRSGIVRLNLGNEMLSISRTNTVFIVRVNRSDSVPTTLDTHFRLVAKELTAFSSSLVSGFWGRNFPLVCSLPFFTSFCCGCGKDLFRYGINASKTEVTVEGRLRSTEKERIHSSKPWIDLGSQEGLPSFWRNEVGTFLNQSPQKYEYNGSYGYPDFEEAWELGNSWKISFGDIGDKPSVARIANGSVSRDCIKKYISFAMVYQVRSNATTVISDKIVEPVLYVAPGSTGLFSSKTFQKTISSNKSWILQYWEFDCSQLLREETESYIHFEVDLIGRRALQLGEIFLSSESSSLVDERVLNSETRKALDKSSAGISCVSLYHGISNQRVCSCSSIPFSSHWTEIDDISAGMTLPSLKLNLANFGAAVDTMLNPGWSLALYWYWNDTRWLRGWDVYFSGTWLSFVSSNPVPSMQKTFLQDSSSNSVFYFVWTPQDFDWTNRKIKSSDSAFLIVPRFSLPSFFS